MSPLTTGELVFFATLILSSAALVIKLLLGVRKQVAELIQTHNNDMHAHGIRGDMLSEIDRAIDQHNRDIEAHTDIRAQYRELAKKLDGLIVSFREYATVTHPEEVREASRRIIEQIVAHIDKKD